MRNIWLALGRLGYYALRPFVGHFIKGTKRTRVVVIAEDHLLLVQNWLGDGSWVLPGGGLHSGEESINGAVREVKEETGIQLDASHLKFVSEQVHDDKRFRFTYDLYYAQPSRRAKVRPQRFEISDVQWKKIDELQDLKLGNEVSTALVAWPKHL